MIDLPRVAVIEHVFRVFSLLIFRVVSRWNNQGLRKKRSRMASEAISLQIRVNGRVWSRKWLRNDFRRLLGDFRGWSRSGFGVGCREW